VALGIPVLTADYDFWLHIDDIAAFNAALVVRTVPTVDGVRVAFDEVWSRRRELEVAPGVTLAVPTLDDLILTKRFGGRPKDLEDIRLLEALRKEET
jgi:hypothetical protein